MPTLAERTGRDSCWARFDSAPDSSICIPRRLWAHDPERTGNWLGRWKASSSPELEESAPKKVNYQLELLARIAQSKTNGLQRATSWLEAKREALSESLRPFDSTGLFRALLLGEDMPAEGLLHELGIFQIIRVSGLHLFFLALGISHLCRLTSQFFRIPTSTAVRSKYLVVGVTWFWCWALAGAPRRLFRPIFLYVLQEIGKRGGFRLRPSALLLCALAVDLVVGMGLCVLQHQSIGAELARPGRALYLFAYSALLFSEARKPSRLRLGFSLWVVLSVVQLTRESLVSLTSVLISWIYIPALCGVVYPLLVLRSILEIPIGPVLHLTGLGMKKMVQLTLESHAVWRISSAAVLIGMIAASILWALPKSYRLRVGAIGAFCAVTAGFLSVRSHTSSIGFADQVEQLDVGQGDAALVIENGVAGTIAGLIDTGSERTVSVAQWLRLFSKLGLDHLDWIAITHLDEDHAGGVFPITALVPIRCVTTSAAELASDRGKRWRARLEKRGISVTSILSDCIPYPALPPQPSSAGGKSANENMSAFLVPLRSGGFFLSAGDATLAAEPRIGRWALEVARSFPSGPRFLKLSHHGSKTSSNPEFLRLIHPTEAWISDGVGNRYGHPSPEVLSRVAALKIPVRRTDQEGGLMIKN